LKFAKVSEAAIQAAAEGRIQDSDLVLLAWLSLRRDYRSDTVKVSNAEMVEGTRKHRSTVIEQKARLLSAGLIEVDERKGRKSTIRLIFADPTGRLEATGRAEATGRPGTSSVEPTRRLETTPPVAPGRPHPSPQDDPLSTIGQNLFSEGRQRETRAREDKQTSVPDPTPAPPPPPRPDRTKPANPIGEALKALLACAAEAGHEDRVMGWAPAWYGLGHQPEYRLALDTLTGWAADYRRPIVVEAICDVVARAREKGRGYPPTFALKDWVQFASERLPESAPSTPEPVEDDEDFDPDWLEKWHAKQAAMEAARS
jgi:hypothetical protein